MKIIAMRIVTVVAAAAFLGVAAHAQAAKPGLWEATVTMKMSGVAPSIPPEAIARMKAQGIQPPPMLTGEPYKAKVCETPEQIGKFGMPEPQAQKDCSFNVTQRGAGGFTGEMVCHGNVNGTGTVKASLQDSEHATAHIEFHGTTQQGKPLSFTVDNSSHYLSASCGDVQPGHPVLQ